jgi:hypothetical protein
MLSSTQQERYEAGQKAFERKTLEDIKNNIIRDLVDTKSKYSVFNNPNLGVLNLVVLYGAVAGEGLEYAGENVVYAISKIPGGQYVLETMGATIGTGLDFAFSAANKGSKFVLSEQQLQSIAQHYKELPHGIKILGQDAATSGIFMGLGKLAMPLTKTVSVAIEKTLVQSQFWNAGKIPTELHKLPKNSIINSREDFPIQKRFYKQGAMDFDQHIDVIGAGISKNLTKAGLDIKKEPANLLFLPDPVGKSIYPTNKAGVSEIDGKMISKIVSSGTKGPNHHPLPEDIVKTFASGRYTSRILEKDTILYRAGNSKKIDGSYFSKDKPISEVQVRINKAIPPIWKNKPKNVIDTVYTYKVPAGTVVHSGKISYQSHHFVGGTQQVVIEEQFWDTLELLKKEPLK